MALALSGQGLAAAAAAIATIITIAIAIVDEQQDDDDEQDTGAIIAAEQISQTHFVSPPFIVYSPYYVEQGGGVTKKIRNLKTNENKRYRKKTRDNFKQSSIDQKSEHKLTLTDFDFI